MKVHILGCRGSTPATGSSFVRYGGDTSAVAISADGEAPTLLLDAGTGLRNLAQLTEVFEGSILVTHLHWDHTHGLPFARALDHQDAKVRLLIPEQDGEPLEVMSRAMGPPHFPITPDQLRGEWVLDWIKPGSHSIEGFDVDVFEVPHKGGVTFGYRVTEGNSNVAYVPDHSFDEARYRTVVEAVDGVELLLHDAQDIDSEWPKAAMYGHSTVSHAIRIGREANVGRTALFHHSFRRTDREIDAIVAEVDDLSVVAVAAGDTYTL